MLRKLLKSLKLKAIVVAVLVWNGLGLIGIWLNHGSGEIRTVAGGLTIALICSLLSYVAIATTRSGWWQSLALRPQADPDDARPGLFFIGLLGAILAAGALLSTFLSGNHT
jgi:hypothetical protein